VPDSAVYVEAVALVGVAAPGPGRCYPHAARPGGVLLHHVLLLLLVHAPRAARRARPVTGWTGRPLVIGAASADDLERELWRAATSHQLGDLVPVDVVRGGLGHRPWDPQPGELGHAPFVHQ